MKVQIKKYINFQKGKAPKETFDCPSNGLVPYLSPEYLRGMDKPLYVKPNNKLVSIEAGELIVLWDGSNAGEVFISKNGILASTMTRIIFDDNEFDNKYFQYALKYNEYYLKAKTAGSGIPHVDKGIIKMIEIFKPKKTEQYTIAVIINKVDEAIAATKNSIEKAERLKKSLMQNLLTGNLKPDGTWRKEDEFYKDEKFGNVPIGWITKKGNKLTNKITKGQSPKWQGFQYQTDGTLFVTSENVLEGRIDVSSPKYLPNEFNQKMKGSQLQKGDILINIVGASIGRCAVFNLDVENANTNQAVCIFRPNDENNSSFLAYYIQWSQTQYRLLGNQVETARANLSLGDFRKFKFVIPESKDEQIEISGNIEKIDTVLQSKQDKINKLERLKKALMQNLLTGRVRIKM